MRTSRADKNYLSWSGDTLQWFLGTDHPAPCEHVPEEVIPVIPSEWDSCLKVSGAIDGVFWYPIIRTAQCRENVLDINHSRRVKLFVSFGRSGETGEQVITIKGGSSEIVLGGPIFSTGKNADIVIGQWSDQSFDKSRDIDLSGLYRPDGKTITVIFARADRNSIKLPRDAQVLRFKSFLFSAYWWLKRAVVKVGIL